MNYQKTLKEYQKKGFTKDLINKCSIRNGSYYFYSGVFQNYLVFIAAEKYVKYFMALLGLIRGNLMECQKNIENITKSDSNFAQTLVDHHYQT